MDGMFIGILRNGVHPGTGGCIPVGAGFDEIHRPQYIFFEQMCRFDIACRLPVLMAKLEYNSAFSHCFAHLPGFGQGIGHTLLAIHMFAGPCCFNNHIGMPVIGRGNNQGIHIGAVDEFFVTEIPFYGFSVKIPAATAPCIGKCNASTLRMRIKHIAHTCKLNIQVFLTQESFVTFVVAVGGSILQHFINY